MISCLQGNGAWDPRRLPGVVAWFNPNPNNVTLNATSEVLTWDGGNGLSAGTQGADEPDWSANGWGQAVPGITMASNVLQMTDAAMLNVVSGTDVAFSLFCTIRTNVVGDYTIVCWQSAGGALSALQLVNTSGGRIRYRRTDDAASSVDVDGTNDVGLVGRRFGLLFAGTSVQVYMNRSLEASGNSNVGALTPDTFKIGSGPLVDSYSGVFADLVIMNRLVSVADYLAYEGWSRKVMG